MIGKHFTNKFLFLASLALILAIFSCKKPEKSTVHDIKILNPKEFSHISSRDTLHVKFEASAESEITGMKILLCDMAHNVIHTLAEENSSTKKLSFESDIFLKNFKIPAANYYLKFCINVADRFFCEAVQIYIFDDQPAENRGFIVIASDAPAVSQMVYSVNFDKEISFRFSNNGIFHSAEYDNNTSQFYINSPGLDGINVYDLKSNVLSRKILPEENFEQKGYLFMRYSNPLLYVSCFTPTIIKGYNNVGTSVVASEKPNTNVPMCIAVQKNYFVGHFVSGNQANFGYLRAFYKEGKEMDSYFLSHNVVEMYPNMSDKEKVFVFANDGKNGLIEVYEPNSHALNTIFTLNGIKIISVRPILSGFAMSTTNGLYQFLPTENKLIPCNTEYKNAKVWENPLTNEIIFSENNTIYMYDNQKNMIVFQVEIPKKILGVFSVVN